MHIVGHSLGAHVAGHAGKKVPGLGLGRITGLDPAGPLFEMKDARVRLDRGDASLVDIIHTSLGLGIDRAIGHVDFYPNGGLYQPGCNLLKKIDCSHKLAYQYFTESINSACQFRAFPCTVCQACGLTKKCNECGRLGCANMGYDASANNPGKFDLTTSSSSPFCKP